MKLHADTPGTYSISGHGPGWVAINGQRYTHSLVLAPATEPVPWGCQRFEDLQAEHFETLLSQQPQVPGLVLLGCGARLRFAPPALLQSLIAKRIGVECMDTPAACRTYNVLVSEGRKVVAALLMT